MAWKALTALAEVEDEAPSMRGSPPDPVLPGQSRLVLCRLCTLSTALAFVAEYASRGKQRMWHESWTSVGLLTAPRVPPTHPTLTCYHYG